MVGRVAVVRAIERMLAASGLDDLFATGDAAVLRAVLADVARGRAGRWYGTASRLARRRGLTAAYAVDRALVLWHALEARRRDDLYRALGVPALARAGALAARWEEVVQTMHPSAGGDPARFHAAREAWDILRDPARRTSYEAWWARTIGPVEGNQDRSIRRGGESAGGTPAESRADSAGAVSAAALGVDQGQGPAGAAASRARPWRSSVRPRGCRAR
jgi:hypothetical protein